MSAHGQHALAVVTADRGSGNSLGNYVDGLLAQIDQAGWAGPKIVSADGWVRGWPDGWQALTDRAGGGVANHFRAMEAAFATGAAFATIFEDDVELCRNALAYIDRVCGAIPDDVAFVTWFDGQVSARAQPSRDRVWLVRIPGKDFAMLQAVTYPRRTLQRLLESPLRAGWPTPGTADLLVGQIVHPQEVAIHVPALVQHIGESSLCQDRGATLEGVRVSRTYARERDALGLLAGGGW
jgi:hypothetical protein